MMNPSILTVDTGGSKTKIALFDTTGCMLGEEHCTGLGRAADGEAPLDQLSEAVNRLLAAHPYAQVKFAIANLGGANDGEVCRELQRMFPLAHVKVYRESSGVLMNALRQAKKADCLLMAGTGTIGIAGGRLGQVILDGWSPYLGDAGSGFWIGMQAIQRSLLALEGTQPLSPLTKQITGRDQPFHLLRDTMLQMKMRDEVRGHFMPLVRRDVAQWTKTASEFARQGDLFSQSIFSDAGKMLAQTVRRGLELANAPMEATIVVLGGLVGCADLWEASFAETLKKDIRTIRYQIIQSDLTEGALAYALQMQETKNRGNRE